MARRIIPDANTEGLWRLDELGAVNAVDITGNGHTGTPQNSCAGVDVSGDGMPWANAREFVKASSRWVEVAAAPALETANLTLACWVKFASLPSGGGSSDFQTLMSQQATGGFGWLFDIKDDKTLRLGVYVNSSLQFLQWDATAFLTTTAWHHFAATYDGTDYRLYFDGDERASGTPTGGGAIGYNSARVAIGDYYNEGVGSVTRYLDGKMAEVLIRGVAMTPWQIKEIYAAVTDPAAGF